MSENKNKRTNEPIKHHYIPQFILRNFCFNDRNELYYYSKSGDTIEIVTTRDIFYEKNLYRDEILNETNPTQIERDFAKYESEIAKLFDDKIIGKSDIVLTIEEERKLKLFCALLSFRSKNARDVFSGFSDVSREFYKPYQEDGNFEEMWKRNLAFLVNCRSLNEVKNNKNIDFPVKIFMQRDTEGLTGSYFSFLERRGNYDFVLGDCYPVNIFGTVNENDRYGLSIMDVLTLTPNLIMLKISKGAENAPILNNLKSYYKEPNFGIDNCFRYHVRKVYQGNVVELDNEIIKNAKIGCVFKDNRRFFWKQ